MINANTGRMMTTQEHIRQSIGDILFTRIGSRVQREPYGSIIPELIDSPLQGQVLAMLIANGVYMALATYEPRITVTNVSIDLNGIENGRARLLIEYKYQGINTAEKLTWGEK